MYVYTAIIYSIYACVYMCVGRYVRLCVCCVCACVCMCVCACAWYVCMYVCMDETSMSCTCDMGMRGLPAMYALVLRTYILSKS